MAYSINGKVYTDHPMMDEICYNCKLILKSIVIKNDVLANNNETENSIKHAEAYSIVKSGKKITFGMYDFTYEEAIAAGFTPNEAGFIVRDKFSIELDQAKVDRAMEIVNSWYINNEIEEENNYYRMLNGLPPFNHDRDHAYLETEYYIALRDSDFPWDFPKEKLSNEIKHVESYDDNGMPNYIYYLHELSNETVNVLVNSGIITQLREQYKGTGYSYMNFLGDKKIDVYEARKAAKWDILYIPNVINLVEDRFKELYLINRDIYVTRSYQEFFAETGEYYDQMMIVIVLSQTFADMITEVPEWYIRRDVFDIRSCKYFLESYGVEFFKEIPLKYQIKIVKNLNKLIKYKSSNKNAEDILSLFITDDNIYIYKYWLYKKKCIGQDYNTDYELEFLASKLGDSYDTYISDTKFRTPYDDITLQDKYWDGNGALDHDTVKNELLSRNFVIEGTKYMSIQYDISLSEYLDQMEYFLNLLFNSSVDTSDIKISIPSIHDTALFKVSDLFLFLVLLTNSYYRKDTNDDSTKVIFPDSFVGEEGKVNEEYYDWKKKYLPEIFIPKTGRIYGFNMNYPGYNDLIKLMLRRHSHFNYGKTANPDDIAYVGKEYEDLADTWITELGLHDFICNLDEEKIPNIKSLVEIYYNNLEVRDKVKNAIFQANDQNDKKTLEYVFQELFTKEIDKNYYQGANDLVDLMRNKEYILYDLYKQIVEESNIDSRQELIRTVMNDIIDTLSYYLQGTGLDYVFSFTTTESFTSIVQYIHMMIGFFKSYKVYFLDPYATFITKGDKVENSAKASDRLSLIRLIKYRTDKAFSADKVSFNANLLKKDSAYSNNDTTLELADIYAYHDCDPLEDTDFDGLNAAKGEESNFKDVDGGIADDNQNVPYIMLNGGASYLGMIDFSDINGAGAAEYNREYHSIDGGYAYDPYSRKTDTMGSAKFNFILDGGASSGREFISNSIHTKLEGTQLRMDARISTKNKIPFKVLNDGLYIDGTYLVLITHFLTMKDTVDEMIELIRYTGSETLENIRLLSDIERLNSRIQSLVDETVEDMEYVISSVDNDYMLGKNKNDIDKMCNDLKYELNTKYNDVNPYGWSDLDELVETGGNLDG